MKKLNFFTIGSTDFTHGGSSFFNYSFIKNYSSKFKINVFFLNEKNFYFCGRTSLKDFSYCKLHLLYAFQPKNKKDDNIKINGKDYKIADLTSQQKYLLELITEHGIKKAESQKALDVATASLIVFENNLKTSLEQINSETEKKVEIIKE